MEVNESELGLYCQCQGVRVPDNICFILFSEMDVELHNSTTITTKKLFYREEICSVNNHLENLSIFSNIAAVI